MVDSMWFECKKCGQCCCKEKSIVPWIEMTTKEKELFCKLGKEKLNINLEDRFIYLGIYTRNDNVKEIKAEFWRFMPKAHCPFLNNNNMCSIYENRPFLCRIYFCGRKSLDEPIAKTIRETFKDKDFYDFRLKEEKKNREYAVEMGW